MAGGASTVTFRHLSIIQFVKSNDYAANKLRKNTIQDVKLENSLIASL